MYGVLQIVLLSLWSTLDSAPQTKLSIAEPAIAVVEALAMSVLSYLEHLKSPKPSGLLNGYLVLTVILDIALARTFWIREGNHAIATVFTAALVCKFCLLMLEEIPKKPSSPHDASFPRETRSGVISRSVFWWLNPLFIRGYRGLLILEDLDIIAKKFDSRRLLEKLDTRWQGCE